MNGSLKISTGWCSNPNQLLICSLFSRENGHRLLICSSLSTAQIIRFILRRFHSERGHRWILFQRPIVEGKHSLQFVCLCVFTPRETSQNPNAPNGMGIFIKPSPCSCGAILFPFHLPVNNQYMEYMGNSKAWDIFGGQEVCSFCNHINRPPPLVSWVLLKNDRPSHDFISGIHIFTISNG